MVNSGGQVNPKLRVFANFYVFALHTSSVHATKYRLAVLWAGGAETTSLARIEPASSYYVVGEPPCSH
eukprot:6608200-Pyramimonas_sp.AAC.2